MLIPTILQVIKFVDKATQLEEQTVTAIDHGILELKTAISKLHTQVDALHSKIDEYVPVGVFLDVLNISPDVQRKLRLPCNRNGSLQLLGTSGLENYWKTSCRRDLVR